MTDLLYCESCGAEFELNEDVLLEDEDGNEYVECPECGELYEAELNYKKRSKLPVDMKLKFLSTAFHKSNPEGETGPYSDKVLKGMRHKYKRYLRTAVGSPHSKATGKKPVANEDYIDEMLEAILEGYHPADVVDRLLE